MGIIERGKEEKSCYFMNKSYGLASGKNVHQMYKFIIYIPEYNYNNTKQLTPRWSHE